MQAKEWELQYFCSNTMEANGCIFKILIACFHFMEIKAQIKPDKVAIFRKVSVKPLLSHISLNKKKNALRVEHLYHGNVGHGTCYHLSTFCPFLLSGQTPWKKKFVVSVKNSTHQFCFQRNNNGNSEYSIGSSSC